MEFTKIFTFVIFSALVFSCSSDDDGIVSKREQGKKESTEKKEKTLQDCAGVWSNNDDTSPMFLSVFADNYVTYVFGNKHEVAGRGYVTLGKDTLFVQNEITKRTDTVSIRFEDMLVKRVIAHTRAKNTRLVLSGIRLYKSEEQQIRSFEGETWELLGGLSPYYGSFWERINFTSAIVCLDTWYNKTYGAFNTSTWLYVPRVTAKGRKVIYYSPSAYSDAIEYH